MKVFFKSFFIHRRLYWLLTMNVVLFVLGYFFPFLFIMGRIYLYSLICLFIFDVILLFSNTVKKVYGKREVPEKLSNGDDNAIGIDLKNGYPFTVWLEVIDELPVQFQKRNFRIMKKLRPGAEGHFNYTLRPVERGEYHFGKMNVYASSSLKLVTKRFVLENPSIVPVYPSFVQLKKYELLAATNRLTEAGVKKIRKTGHQFEFDHIRKYVRGDDYRTINWKATARKADVMANQYEDEKSQQVWSVIDSGRVMRMPFEGMTLLDYAINSSLVMGNISMLRHDKTGLITFSDKVDSYLPAARNKAQMQRLLEILYNQKTRFAESNFEWLYSFIRHKITQRSLIMLYTNFESLVSLNRQMEYITRLKTYHVVVVVFFKNTKLRKLLESNPKNTEDIYIKTIAEKFEFEKKQIVYELKKRGVYSILTEPRNLTVNVINKYLELKAGGMI